MKRARRLRAGKADLPLTDEERHPDFAYVAGYTPAGFPYGITWAELEQLDAEPGGDLSPDRSVRILPEDDVPF